MREDLFKRYLDYRRQQVKFGVDSRIMRSRGLYKKDARQFRKTDAYREEYDRVMAEELARFEYENAVSDTGILRQYEKLETMAAEIADAGQKPNFGSLKQQYAKLLESRETMEVLRPFVEEILHKTRSDIRHRLKARPVRLPDNQAWPETLDSRNVDRFVEYAQKYPWRVAQEMCVVSCTRGHYCHDMIRKVLDPETILPNRNRRESERLVYRALYEINGQIEKELQKTFTANEVLKLVFSNQRYLDLRGVYEQNRQIYNNIVESIPDRIENLYPATRQMHRHFVLHVGPTNSGKTHDAMQTLRQCESGVYLAPLRLLAYEQFERLNDDGYPCSMVTGEEMIQCENALYTASTVEMCSFEAHYECAVIDEAQMIADKFRGGAWTNAILGVMADEVHVCTAPEAEEIILKMIEMCGDSYEIRRHERLTSLEFEDQRFDLRRDVQPHDAFIVFSRKQVHNIAAELQRKGRRVSIIYGSLPYDVRHEEARRFAEGENDVIVSTDAIGMGMNLPVRRIVFLENTKFDGETRRFLKGTEIKQIAGRAGRFGVFDTGYAAASDDVEQMKALFEEKTESIRELYVSFPKSLLGIEGTLSATIEQWQKVKLADGIMLEDTSEMLQLAREAEQMTEDKDLVYELATIPFDIGRDSLKRLWYRYARRISRDKEISIETDLAAVRKNRNASGTDIKVLEECSEQCDLLYNFDRKFNDGQLNEEIRAVRTDISKTIMRILSRQKLQGKTCRYCGRTLPWDSKYSVCDRCYSKMNY